MIQLKQIEHAFKLGRKGSEREVPVLRGIDLTVKSGEIATLIGRSGSGKSTLLHIVGGFIRPTSGSITIAGQDTTAYGEGQWADFRRRHVGVVFQNFQLIPSMTAYENVELPLVLQGTAPSVRRKLTLELMDRLGIADYSDHYPSELSGGQQQRVGIARALILNPPIILADEPTGSLDSENEEQFLQLLQSLNRESKLTLLIITHDDKVASIGHKKLRIEDGKLLNQAEPRKLEVVK
ncbi:ABC transporter ATP-binding protein YtrE [Paenibacillus baekrokdamisoli]|uniref:ABC transporter ATP-binding protein YtrE n=1 Tax=Paenibacillus baekrokdamisoli TaxID=1712516 RepID=A0A3G9ISJ9_9BACL|nr:ABC transporter ATP-binding protein [Paenibacillus baekrokdamisoli]MBB3071694.1 acetoin utilization transport system ATP-binding protein [Paenibacillus baekrokdamisoli]BBH21797.1 ABC transporter ATP-binding protein YtrE [Paenibacillus baekrokdamisoli]